MPGIRAAINQIESSDMQAEWRKHLAAQVKPRTFCATECCNGIAMHKFGDIYYCEDCDGTGWAWPDHDEPCRPSCECPNCNPM